MYTDASEEFNRIIQESGRRTIAEMQIENTILREELESVIINGASNASDNITIGSCVSTQLESTIIGMIDGSLAGKKITLREGLMYEDDSEELIPMGQFNIHTVNIDGNRTKITAYDNMILFDKEYIMECTSRDTNDILEEIERKSGIAINYPDKSVELTGVPDKQTFKKMISIIATALGKFTYIDREGKLTFGWYQECGVMVDEDKYFRSKLAESNYTVGSLSWNHDTKSEIFGEGTGIVIENDYISQETAQEIWESVSGFSYRPGNISFNGDIRLDVTDVLTHSVDGIEHRVPCMELTHTFNGGFVTDVNAVGYSELEYETKTEGPLTEKVNATEKNVKKISAAILLIGEDLEGLSEDILTTKEKLESWCADNDVTMIDGSKIFTGSVKAKQIDVSDLFAQNIKATGTIEGAKLIAGTIEGAKLIASNADFRKGILETDRIWMRAKDDEANDKFWIAIGLAKKEYQGKEVPVLDFEAFETTTTGGYVENILSLDSRAIIELPYKDGVIKYSPIMIFGNTDDEMSTKATIKVKLPEFFNGGERNNDSRKHPYFELLEAEDETCRNLNVSELTIGKSTFRATFGTKQYKTYELPLWGAEKVTLLSDADIVNNLTTDVKYWALSASMGVKLNEAINEISKQLDNIPSMPTTSGKYLRFTDMTQGFARILGDNQNIYNVGQNQLNPDEYGEVLNSAGATRYGWSFTAEEAGTYYVYYTLNKTVSVYCTLWRAGEQIRSVTMTAGTFEAFECQKGDELRLFSGSASHRTYFTKVYIGREDNYKEFTRKDASAGYLEVMNGENNIKSQSTFEIMYAANAQAREILDNNAKLNKYLNE